MKLVCLMCVTFLMLFYFLWAERKWKDIGNISDFHKNRCLDFFIPGIWFLVMRFRRKFHLHMRKERYEQLRKMYVGVEEPELFCLYYSKMGSMMAGILLMGLLLLSGSFAVRESGDLIKSYYIQRQEVAGGEKSVSVQADNGTEKKEITVKIPEREYTSKEKKKAFARAKKKVQEALPGENATLDKVTKPLVLLKSVPGCAINITWELGETGLIHEDGSIDNEEITEPEEREITAILSYGEEEERLVQLLTVYPQKQSPSQKFWSSWQKLWSEGEEGSRTQDYVMLPQKVAGKIVTYQQTGLPLFQMILAVMALFILLVPLWQQSRTKEELNRRQEQLRKDYPEFVEHFVLLIGAGLTVKGTWERIVRDYEKRQGERHYVYEEMAWCLREMDCGMSEAKAYELFGKRTGLLLYMKFCTLIVQNLRKGSSDLLQLLDYEVSNAFHQRKESAKELGEKAGTKLLLPMVVMLALIFVMILYAAFQSM